MLYLVILLLSLFTSGPPAGERLSPLLGAWKAEGSEGAHLLLFEAERLVEFRNGQLRFERVAYQMKPGGDIQILRRVLGQRQPLLTATIRQGKLQLHSGGSRTTFQRLERTPAELAIQPLALGKAGPLSGERINALRRDLGQRERRSQRLQAELARLPAGDPARSSKMKEMQTAAADDSRALARVLQEVGWIDSRRFGTTGLQSAYLLCLHTSDPRLMLTGVQQVEKEVKKSNFDAESWALLHDRFRVVTGQREKFGSRIWNNARGEICLGPLEDRKRVDEYRKAYHLPSLAESLERYREAGRVVQVVEDD